MLDELFRPCGEIVDIRYAFGQAYAFVEYKTNDEASAALALDKTPLGDTSS